MVSAKTKHRTLLSHIGYFLAVLLPALIMVAKAPAQTEAHGYAEDLKGKAVDPFDLASGHPTVLLFVRTDCPISNRYAPLLRKLSEKYRGSVNFWLVYPDRAETAVQIRSHQQDFHYTIPALRDVHLSLVKRAQATITPEAAVFDPAGNLIYHGRIDNWYESPGRSRLAATSHELEDGIAAALSGRPMTPDHAGAVGCYISDIQ